MLEQGGKAIVTGDVDGSLHDIAAGTVVEIEFVPLTEEGKYLVTPTFGDGSSQYVGIRDLAPLGENPDVEALKQALALAEKQRDVAAGRERDLQERVIPATKREGQRLLDAFRGDVRDRMDKAVKETRWLTRAQANEILSDLDCEKVTGRFRVRVSDRNYNEILVVDIDAEDEEEAKELVSGDLNVSATIASVTFSISYDGEGDVDSIEDSIEEEPEDEDDSLASSYEDDLSFDVEEI